MLCRDIRQNSRESVLTDQLLRSGTSIGANIHEAQYAQGTKDFISKFEISLKEVYETEYWLELLFETGYKKVCLFRSVIQKQGSAEEL
ncbi:MAG: four helix bundle protein [Oscillospiraceae bacterium]|nr:four helix bundle protein [Oscillospiraceae bacterium]